MGHEDAEATTWCGNASNTQRRTVGIEWVNLGNFVAIIDVTQRNQGRDD
jgi:hypothetical protein